MDINDGTIFQFLFSGANWTNCTRSCIYLGCLIDFKTNRQDGSSSSVIVIITASSSKPPTSNSASNRNEHTYMHHVYVNIL